MTQVNSANPIVLGINTVYHETAACILRDGQVVAFAEQERFSRIKKGKSARVDNPDELPVEAINNCLERTGLSWRDVDRVALSFDPSLRGRPDPNDRTTEGDWGSPSGEANFLRGLRRIPRRLSELAGADFSGRIQWIPHERAHAASAYFASAFSEAAVMSVDGIGEASTTLLGYGLGNEIFELETVRYPHSLGFVWEKICKYLGFGEYDAGKLMALASFGSAADLEESFAEIVNVLNGAFQVAPDELLFRVEDYGPLERRFGERRRPNGIVGPREAALSAALQRATEEILLGFAHRLREQTGSKHLCLAGGVMMNCVALGRLLAEGPFEEIFVQPVAHDAGTAIGAALAAYHAEIDDADRWVMNNPYLGPEYSRQQMEDAFGQAGVPYHWSRDACQHAAELIADGKIIGWFQGAAEAGPRALGNRSILADPRRPGSKELINLKVKHREYFRPFAPAVLAEEAGDWFDIPRDSFSLRFMSFALPVRPEKQQAVPAIVHVDGTGRLQVVDRNVNPNFHQLISAFRDMTGVPMVINTSFNTYDEPMVCSPEDAVRTFVRTDLDYLFLGNLVAENPRVARRGAARPKVGLGGIESMVRAA